MKTENYEGLLEIIKMLGFGEDKVTATQLLDAMKRDEPDFTIATKKQFKNAIGGETTPLESVLNFRRSDKDWYFFNSYQATIHAGDPQHERSHLFFINQGSGITQKEALNLLEGRAVHKTHKAKDGEFEGWMQLDFTLKTEKGNNRVQFYSGKGDFDLEEALEKQNFKELQNPGRKDMILRSLRKGNIEVLTKDYDGQEIKRFAEANPRFKSISLRKQLGPAITASHGEGKTNEKGKGTSSAEEEGEKQKRRSGKKTSKTDEESPETVSTRKNKSR